MNIVFFSLGDSRSSLYGDLSKYFVSQGHSVTMIVPSSKSDTLFDEGVQVRYIKSLPFSGTGLLGKGLANLLLPYLCDRFIRKEFKSTVVDLILCSTPPVAFYRPIASLKKKNREAKSYLILRDIWPEAFNLFDYELRHPFIYKFFRIQEKKLYESSDVIGCMSPGNIAFVAKSNPEVKDKLALLPNWGKVSEQNPSDISIKEKYGLEGKFVVIYGGNMSVPQGLENILHFAELIKSYDDVICLLIGKGTQKDWIRNEVEQKGVQNIKIMDFLPKQDYEAILKVCDVGLISLTDKLKTPSIPSKTISYWDLKIPIFAITDHITDYGESIIDESKSGTWAYAGDDEKILSSFEKLYANPPLRKTMGENGHKYLVENCSLKNTYDKIMIQLYGKQ